MFINNKANCLYDLLTSIFYQLVAKLHTVYCKLYNIHILLKLKLWFELKLYVLIISQPTLKCIDLNVVLTLHYSFYNYIC